MMSVTGTLVVGAPSASSDGLGQNLGLTSLPGLLSLHDLLEGSNTSTRVYQCDNRETNGCLAPTISTQPFKGLRTRVDQLLMGEDGASGLLGKFSGTNTTALTQEELAFMELVPTAVGAMIRNLAREDPGIARVFIREASPIIALELAEDLLNALWKAVEAATMLGKNTYLPLLKMHLEAVRKDLDHEYAVLSGRFGNSQSLMRFYQDLMTSLPTHRYPIPGGPSSSSPTRAGS
jgi:conjugative transfer pilus assembly protein TraH